MQNIMADYELSQKSREFLDSRDSVPKSSLVSLKIQILFKASMRCLSAMGLRMIICEDLDTDYHKLIPCKFFKDLSSGKQKFNMGAKLLACL